jgi:hypothetical protein
MDRISYDQAGIVKSSCNSYALTMATPQPQGDFSNQVESSSVYFDSVYSRRGDGGIHLYFSEFPLF